MCEYMGIECHHETFGERKRVNVERVRDILVENYGYDSSMNGGSLSWIK